MLETILLIISGLVSFLVGIYAITLRGYSLYRKACCVWDGIEMLPTKTELFRFGLGKRSGNVVDLSDIETTSARDSSSESTPKTPSSRREASSNRRKNV